MSWSGQLVHCDDKNYSTKYYPVHLLRKRNVSHRVLMIHKLSLLIWLASMNYVYIYLERHMYICTEFVTYFCEYK